MPINKGYLTSKESDEYQTPSWAVKPIIKYIPQGAVVWCPFDLPQYSEYTKQISANGNKVISTHIANGQDFFVCEPEEPYDIIVSNPPFSTKDKILKRLSELNKPYAMLLPLPSLQGQTRFEYIKDCQALVFDKRINYYSDMEKTKMATGCAFASIYVCKNFLPKDLIFERLEDKI